MFCIGTASSGQNAGGLPQSIVLSENAKLMLTRNINVTYGLVNSAVGIVAGFIPNVTDETDLNTYQPKFILVKFNDERVGKAIQSIT